jgi:hypothetical protein
MLARSARYSFVGMSADERPFDSLLAQLADGEKWKVARGEGWEEFARTLGDAIGSLDIRRRQAIVMVLVALSTGSFTSRDVEEFLSGRDMEDDNEVEALITWLRTRRPRFFDG